MYKLLSKNVLTYSIQQILRLLPSALKKKAGVTLCLQIINSFLEVFGLAAIIPLISVVLQDNAIKQSRFLNMAYTELGFTDENAFLFFLCGVFLGVILLKNLMALFITYYSARYSFSLYEHFSTKLHRYFYHQGFLYFKQRNSNKIVRDISTVAQRFAARMVIPLFMILTEVFLLLLVIIGLLLYNAQVVLLLAVILGPASAIFFRLVRKRIQQYNEEMHELSADMTKTLFQSIFGYVDVKINNRDSWFFSAHGRNVSTMKRIKTTLQLLDNTPPRVMELAMMVGIVLTIVFGITVWEDKERLSVLLGVLALAAFRVLPSINRIMKSLMTVKGHQYVFEVLAQASDFEKEVVKADPLEFGENIAVENVSFWYPQRPDEPVLQNFSLTIQKGERVGIIGKSGSGKTTLLNLLLRFITENEGQITVDGKPLTPENLLAWRNLVGYVQQEVYLLDNTLAANIAFGQDKEDIDEDRVWEVIRQASLEEVVKALPDGIHTWVGERGSQLSGGQRQRVGIARALYGGAQILCFDEATSALDNVTEEEITQSINALSQQDFTMLIIAHRLTTLKYCDRIIELEDGKIKHIGSYQELGPQPQV